MKRLEKGKFRDETQTRVNMGLASPGSRSQNEGMTDESSGEGIAPNKAFRKQMLDKHRTAFDIWLRLAELLEDAVVKDRSVQSAFSRSLDLLFIQAFKSHGSLYFLCVNGCGEDAATIVRRLFEIALQVGYLDSDDAAKEERGKQFLVHYWHNAKDIAASVGLPEERRKFWQDQYDQYQHLLKFKKNGKPMDHWFGSNFRELAVSLGCEGAYDADYKYLSDVAHCSSRGILLEIVNNTLQLKSDRLIPALLVYGTKYTLCTAACWNKHFGLIRTEELEELQDKTTSFDFKRHP